MFVLSEVRRKIRAAQTAEEKEKFLEYGTGLSFELPSNHVMLIFPRSSLSNKDLILANHVGVLDSGYRGELKFRFKKTGKVRVS